MKIQIRPNILTPYLRKKAEIINIYIIILFTFLQAYGLDDTKSDPLVIITFPIDNHEETSMGHTVIKYSLYPSGITTNEKDVYGNRPIDFNTAWLNQSQVNAVLKLVDKISASKAQSRLPFDAILMKGIFTHNQNISRAYSQNITDIRTMLGLLGGVRSDLQEHLK